MVEEEEAYKCAATSAALLSLLLQVVLVLVLVLVLVCFDFFFLVFCGAAVARRLFEDTVLTSAGTGGGSRAHTGKSVKHTGAAEFGNGLCIFSGLS